MSYVNLSGGTTAGSWVAVNINDGNKYIVFVRFYNAGGYDWYAVDIASYDQTTDKRTIYEAATGGVSMQHGGVHATSNGLWVKFWDANSSNNWSSSYARVWYIPV